MDRSHRRAALSLPAADGIFRYRRRLGQHGRSVESHEFRAGAHLESFARHQSGFEYGARRSGSTFERRESFSERTAFRGDSQGDRETTRGVAGSESARERGGIGFGIARISASVNRSDK